MAEGVAIVSGIAADYFSDSAAAMEDEDTPYPAPITLPYSVGDLGPEGGILFAVSYPDGNKWFEVAQQSIGPFKMLNGAAAAACAEYSSSPDGKTDWFLPDFTQLNYVYGLYNEGKLTCQPELYWSSTPHQEAGSSYYSAIKFSEGAIFPINEEVYLLARPIRQVSTEELQALYSVCRV